MNIKEITELKEYPGRKFVLVSGAEIQPICKMDGMCCVGDNDDALCLALPDCCPCYGTVGIFMEII